MTTETTDPLEQAVMEAADALVEHAALHTGDGGGNFCSPLKASSCYPEGDKLAERLRLHVQLFAASRYEDGLREAADVCYDEGHGFDMLDQALVEARDKRLALEARLQADA